MIIALNCSALTGQSPYTMISDKKVHLYERKKYPKRFTSPKYFQGAFYDCIDLTDYELMLDDWKEYYTSPNGFCRWEIF